jgi:hypothetical protein
MNYTLRPSNEKRHFQDALSNRLQKRLEVYRFGIKADLKRGAPVLARTLIYSLSVAGLLAVPACGGSGSGSGSGVVVSPPPPPPPPPPSPPPPPPPAVETFSDRAINQTTNAPLASIDAVTGKLFYGPYANQGQSNADHLIPDFSHAGYMGGGVALPSYDSIPVRVALSVQNGDDFARIQQALNDVASFAPDARGIRGAVLLTAGLYEVSETLTFPASGVVLRGEGQGATGTILRATTTTPEAVFIEIRGSGSGDNPTAAADARQVSITDSYVPVGATKIEIASTEGYAVGDRIAVMRTPNENWLGIGGINTEQYGWTPSRYTISAERRVTAINGNELTLDIPLVDTIEDQFGGGEVYRMASSARLTQIGVENLRIETLTRSDVTRRDRAVLGITMREVENSWVRDVTARYFSRAFNWQQGTYFVTAEDVAHIDPNFEVVGGNHYAFDFGSGGMNLFQRCYSDKSRHAFTSGSTPVGPNVFLDCLAENGANDSGPHQRWAVGTLFDNTSDDLIRIQNRTDSGSGHGWAGAQQMIWNGTYDEIVVQAPFGAMNWSVGAVGTVIQGSFSPSEPNGLIASEAIPVSPRSLYLQQLEDRLGTAAVEAVTVTPQRTRTVYSDLSHWGGEGALDF